MSGTKEYLSHTADVKIRLCAETLPELFQLGLESLNQLLQPNFTASNYKGSLTENISLDAADTTALLIDFLSEVLTFSQVYKAIFFDFTIDSMTDCTLIGTINGTKVDFFQEDVKAVTYHEAEVTINDRGNWETIIIFDI